MFVFETQIRVRYAETDQMGYVYYGNYAAYFEVARVESFRSLGYSYKQMEEAGILMPVLEYKCKYIRPARYDDLLTVKLRVAAMPQVRIHFEYETTNQEGTLLNVAETTLVFISKHNHRPCNPPPDFISMLDPLFL